MYVFLLGVTGLFDFLAIFDSLTDNFSMCSDASASDFRIHTTLKSFQSTCSVNSFSLVGILMIVAALGMYLTSERMSQYKRFISIDNL